MADTMIPEGHGKAEAMRTYLSRGGGLTKLGRYRSGPMKGMTVQQAQTAFEQHWATVGNDVKEKYAGIARNSLAPSEDPNAGKTESSAEMQKRQRDNRMGYYQRTGQAGETIPRPAQTTAPAASAGGSTPAPAPSPTSQPAGSGIPGAARRGGASPSGIAGRQTTGASPSAGITIPSQSPSIPRPSSPAPSSGPGSLAEREMQRRKDAINAAPTGAPVVSNPGKGINRLTGLPFGYQAGDKLPDGADPAMQKRAADSVTRQQTASGVSAAKMLVPDQIPKPPSVEQRAADEMRRQAEINRNPSKVNPDDPAKFFTGKTKPLDELVNRQPSIPRPGSRPVSGGIPRPKFASIR